MTDAQPQQMLDLAPIPAPDRVLHSRAALHDIDAAWLRAVDADDWRDARAADAAPANPEQLRLFDE